jgi:hypothetical protein
MPVEETFRGTYLWNEDGEGNKRNIPNPGTEKGAYVQSIDGLVVKESFKQTDLTDNVYTTSESVKRQGLEVLNKGTAVMTYAVGTVTIELDVDEASVDSFDDFSEVTFSEGATFKAKTYGLRS